MGRKRRDGWKPILYFTVMIWVAVAGCNKKEIRKDSLIMRAEKIIDFYQTIPPFLLNEKGVIDFSISVDLIKKALSENDREMLKGYVPEGEKQMMEVKKLVAELKSLPDRDGDGVPDRYDRCPEKPESKNGLFDYDGCPEKVGFAVICGNAKINDNRCHEEKLDGGCVKYTCVEGGYRVEFPGRETLVRIPANSVVYIR